MVAVLLMSFLWLRETVSKNAQVCFCACKRVGFALRWKLDERWRQDNTQKTPRWRQPNSHGDIEQEGVVCPFLHALLFSLFFFFFFGRTICSSLNKDQMSRKLASESVKTTIWSPNQYLLLKTQDQWKLKGQVSYKGQNPKFTIRYKMRLTRT